MHGEPIEFLPWWWYAIAVLGLGIFAILWAPNNQGKRPLSRLGLQLWTEGLPTRLGPIMTLFTSITAVGLLYAIVGLEPAYAAFALLLPWLIHAIAGSIWNAARVHLAYHQYRSMLLPFLLLLAVPYSWWRLTGSDIEIKTGLIILVSVFAALYITSVLRASIIYLNRGPGPLYFRIAYLCALEAIPWLWIHNYLSASAK